MMGPLTCLNAHWASSQKLYKPDTTSLNINDFQYLSTLQSIPAEEAEWCCYVLQNLKISTLHDRYFSLMVDVSYNFFFGWLLPALLLCLQDACCLVWLMVHFKYQQMFVKAGSIVAFTSMQVVATVWACALVIDDRHALQCFSLLSALWQQWTSR